MPLSETFSTFWGLNFWTEARTPFMISRPSLESGEFNGGLHLSLFMGKAHILLATNSRVGFTLAQKLVIKPSPSIEELNLRWWQILLPTRGRWHTTRCSRFKLNILSLYLKSFHYEHKSRIGHWRSLVSKTFGNMVALWWLHKYREEVTRTWCLVHRWRGFIGPITWLERYIVHMEHILFDYKIDGALSCG